MTLQTGRTLPWWDYLILPGLSILTVVALLTLAEVTANVGWPRQTVDSCLIQEAPSGLRYRPNCTAKMKIPESSWVINTYNECGFRSESSCLVRRPGSLRIAILGASSAEGYMVPYEQTYTALTEQILAQHCNRPVDVQNLAVAGIHLTEAVHRTQEALALMPDLVILVVTPYDLWKDIDDLESVGHGEAKPQIPSSTRTLKLHERLESFKEMIRESSALTVIRHFLYENPGIYLKFYLQSGKGAADFLQLPFSTPWRNGFDHLELLLVEMAAQTRAQGIPLAIVPSFHRPQVALMNAADRFPEKDPYAFEREIARIAHRHGIVDLEMTEDFRRADQREELFYIADGHMDSRGHETFARAFGHQIVDSRVLEAAGCLAPTPGN